VARDGGASTDQKPRSRRRPAAPPHADENRLRPYGKPHAPAGDKRAYRPRGRSLPARPVSAGAEQLAIASSGRATPPDTAPLRRSMEPDLAIGGDSAVADRCSVRTHVSRAAPPQEQRTTQDRSGSSQSSCCSTVSTGSPLLVFDAPSRLKISVCTHSPVSSSASFRSGSAATVAGTGRSAAPGV